MTPDFKDIGVFDSGIDIPVPDVGISIEVIGVDMCLIAKPHIRFCKNSQPVGAMDISFEHRISSDPWVTSISHADSAKSIEPHVPIKPMIPFFANRGISFKIRMEVIRAADVF